MIIGQEHDFGDLAHHEMRKWESGSWIIILWGANYQYAYPVCIPVLVAPCRDTCTETQNVLRVTMYAIGATDGAGRGVAKFASTSAETPK